MTRKRTSVRMSFFLALLWRICAKEPCWTRKAALGDSPVDCRNRRGFSAEKRVHLRAKRYLIKTITQLTIFIFMLPVGLEPIIKQLSGGQLLPPVQTLVATFIFSPEGRKCTSSPTRGAKNPVHESGRDFYLLPIYSSLFTK